MKIAVTGANGFIGQHLVKRLEKDGHEVVKVPRDILYNKQKTQRFLKSEKPEQVYHLAAYGNHSSHTQDAYVVEANTVPLFNILESMSLINFELINVSTSSVGLPVQTLYSASKRLGEEACEIYRKKHDLNVRSVRPYSVYGPGEDDARLIPTLIRALSNPKMDVIVTFPPDDYKNFVHTYLKLAPNAYHDWIHVEDFVNAIVDTRELHIGTGRSYSNLEILNMLKLISNKSVEYHEIAGRPYDTDEWKSPVSVKHRSIWEGLIETYHHYNAKHKIEVALTRKDLGDQQKAFAVTFGL